MLSVRIVEINSEKFVVESPGQPVNNVKHQTILAGGRGSFLAQVKFKLVHVARMRITTNPDLQATFDCKKITVDPLFTYIFKGETKFRTHCNYLVCLSYIGWRTRDL